MKIQRTEWRKRNAQAADDQQPGRGTVSVGKIAREACDDLHAALVSPYTALSPIGSHRVPMGLNPREAGSIATNFSFISLGFFAVLVESAGILDHYGDVVLWNFILSFVMAVIMIRIPPLRLLPDTMYDGSPRPAEQRIRYNSQLVKNAFIMAAETGNSLDIAEVFRSTLRDVFIFAQKISAYIMCIYVLAMVIVKNTSIATYLGLPFIPILNLLGIPNAAEIAPSFLLGIAEVALPSAYISGMNIAPAAAFFVVTVTALQIIMFSNSAVSIMESDIPLNAGKLILIFIIRTLLAMPLVAIVTHLIF